MSAMNEATGGKSCVTTTTSVDVHPFVLSVTVMVYVPGAFTTGVVVVPPDTIPGPDQLYVTPVVDVAERLNVFAAQEIFALAPAFAPGGVVLVPTV